MKSIHLSDSGNTDSENHLIDHSTLENQIHLTYLKHRLRIFKDHVCFQGLFQALKI